MMNDEIKTDIVTMTDNQIINSTALNHPNPNPNPNPINNTIQMLLNKLIINVTTEAAINIASTTATNLLDNNNNNNNHYLNIMNNLLITNNNNHNINNSDSDDSDIKIDSIWGIRNSGNDARDYDDDGDGDDGNNQIIWAKLTAMIVLFCASLICGLIPLRLSKIIKWFNNNKNRKKINKLMSEETAAAAAAQQSQPSQQQQQQQQQPPITQTVTSALSSSTESATGIGTGTIQESPTISLIDDGHHHHHRNSHSHHSHHHHHHHHHHHNHQNVDKKTDNAMEDEEFSFSNSTGRSALIITMLFSFGGGVLLSTTFLHLLPEVIENIEQLQHDGHLPEFSFPLAELLMCLGFFIMYLVEEIVHAYLHKHQTAVSANNDLLDQPQLESAASESAHSHSHSHPHSHSHLHSHHNNHDSSAATAATAVTGAGAGAATSANENNETVDGVVVSNTIELNNNNNNTSNHNNNNNNNNNKSQAMIDCPEPVIPEMLSSIPAGQHHHHGHSHLPKTHPNETLIVTSLRGLLIVLALSVHELFEGLAVGLETITETVWYMFGAVAAHKLILAFCVGIELIVTKTKLWLSICYVFTFAVVSPIGIGIGILIDNMNRQNSGMGHQNDTEQPDDDQGGVELNDATITSNIASVILQGLASGTLLYVVFFEILQKGRSGLFQYFAVLAGFSIMFGLKFLIGHEHSHHEH